MSQFSIEKLQTVDEIVKWDVPGNGRSLSKAEIAKLYGKNATRPIPEGYKKPKGLALWTNKEFRGIICKVFDDGRREFISKHLTVEDADKEAGRLRDTMTDDECGGDFTYLATERGKAKAKKK